MGILWPSRKVIDAALNGPNVAAAETFPAAGSTHLTSTGMLVPVSGAWEQPVSRALALSLPTLRRGVELKVTTLAGLPLERIDAAGARVDLGWLEQPEPGRARFATMCDIGYDLEFDNVAYLRVHERDGNRQPARGGCEYIPLTRIGNIIGADGKTTITVDGVAVPREDVIGFAGASAGSGILRDGARIIRTAIALEAAARRYADKPRPSERLVNTSGIELTDDEIDALLTAYATSLNGEAIAYSNQGLDIKQVGWNSSELQLVEARQFTATQIANLVGVPEHFIAGAAAASGGNMTYANVAQENRALVDYGIKPLARAIESRLSMSDVAGAAWTNQVTPKGTVVRFNMDALLRGNPLERAQLYNLLLPLGVMTVEQAQAMEDLIPVGRQQA